MLFARMPSAHVHIEGMRFDDRATPHQVVLLRLETKGVDLAIQALERDAGAHARSGKRFVVLVGVEPELRRHAGFEDGDFECEVAITQHAAAVRATLELGGGGGVAMLAFGARRGRAVSAGRQQSEREKNDETAHGAMSWADAVRLSTSTSSAW